MSLTREEIVTLVGSRTWFHRYELVEGVTTPGLYSVNAGRWVDEQFPGEDLTGRRVLEIGTWDGPYAFALEARGAIVEATDIQDPDATGFNVAKRILNSRVRYTRVSVYDVEAHFEKASFDVILFLGVFYHLKYPVKAFEALSSLLTAGGRLYFEGECLLTYGSAVDGRAPRWVDRVMLRRLGNSGYPASLFYSGPFKHDASNWHVPNVACLGEWLSTAGLRMQSHRCARAPRGIAPFPTQRVSGVAVKIGGTRTEHPMVEEIGDQLRHERAAAVHRAQMRTVRTVAARTVDRLIAPLGFQRVGLRIERAARP